MTMPSQIFLGKDDDDDESITFHHHYFIEWIAGYAYNGREIVLEDSTANLATASSKIIATFIMIV